MFVAALLLAAPLLAAPVREDKISIYFVYNQGNPGQRNFINMLYDRFKVLGFKDFLKKEGIAWVEGNYDSIGPVTNYLNITRDDLIYFAVVTADNQSRLIREIVRVRIPVPPGLKDRQMRALADKYSSVLYYDTQNTHDLFKNNWKRQSELLNPEGAAIEPVSISLYGKEVSLPLPAYQRAGIGTVMVPDAPAFFQSLGVEASSSPSRSGNAVHLKRGAIRLDLYTGDVQDRKIFEAANGGVTFIRPIDPGFAYPEVRKGTVFVPLHLVLTRLQVPVDWAETGNKVVLTKK
jgi:hypothetical protein